MKTVLSLALWTIGLVGRRANRNDLSDLSFISLYIVNIYTDPRTQRIFANFVAGLGLEDQ